MLLAQMVVEYSIDITALSVGADAAIQSNSAIGASAEAAGGSLASLGDKAFTTGVGFDGLASSTAASQAALASADASFIEADASLAAMSVEADAAAASMNTAAASQGALGVAAKDAAISLGTVELAMAAVVAVVGIISVVTSKMSGNFQQSMTKLTTTANESTNNIKMVGDGILAMSVQVGTGAQKLGDAMYWIESGGAHGAIALTDLKIAAMGAKTENANLDDVSKALMFTLNNFGSTGLTAAQAMNTLIAGVGGGEMSMQDLSTAISNVMPTAKIFGISLTDIVGGLDTMTMQGDDAANAATHLSMMIKTLEAPSKAGSAALASIGLTTQQVTDEMRLSLPDAIEMITSAMKKKFPEGSTAYNEALKAISGGSRSMAAIMETSGTQLDTFRLNVDNINKAVKSGGNSIAGWADVQQNFNFKLDQAKAVIEAFGIKIGTALLPVAGQMLDGFEHLVTIGGTVVSFFQHNQAALIALQAILIPVAGAIGGLLVFALVAAAVAAWTFAAGMIAATWPFLLVGAGIALLIVGLILLAQHWSQIAGFLQGVWSAFTGWFMGVLGAIGSFFVGLWTNIANFFINVWANIIASLSATWSFIVNVVKIGALLVLAAILAPFLAIGALFIWLYEHNIYFKMLVDDIVGFVKFGVALLINAWQTSTDWIVAKWQWLAGMAGTVFAEVNSTVMGVVNFLIGWLTFIWSAEVQAIGALWSKLSGLAQNAWNAVIGVFNAAGGRINGAISTINSIIANAFNWLIAQALGWGASVISSFISGIESKLGALGSMLGNAAATVANFLGFHSPTRMGAGADADTWAPAFVDMYAAGIEGGIPRIQAAVQRLASPIAVGASGSNARASSGGGRQTTAPSQGQPIYLILDGRKLGQGVIPYVGPELAKEMRAVLK